MPKKGDRHRAPRTDNMKCIRNKGTGKIIRVTNEYAFEQVDNGYAVLVPKQHWKAQERQEKKAA